ncbi:MAG: hypothetical protein APF77_06255 [Clostridia bacterium BRH_c25]|nr:MAG: hypothetical protein APF77_06255 [Clostridia bacterium BRH_c25]
MGKIVDERILTGKRRINSSAFGICFLALWGILLYRQFVLQQSLREYSDIFLLTVGISLYVVINNILQGFYYTYRNNSTKKKAMVIGALTGTIVFSLSQILIMKYDLTDGKDIVKIIVQAVIFLVVWIACQHTLFRMSERQADKGIE